MKRIKPKVKRTREAQSVSLFQKMANSPLVQLDEPAWRQLVLASAYAVLNAREDKLPKAQRLAVDVCDGGAEATVVRSAGPPELAAFLAWLRSRVVSSDEARACFDAALTACQDEWRSIPDDREDDDVAPSCCFSRLSTGLLQVTLFGNKGGRTESSHIVHGPDWSQFVEALMVVGSVHEWLDGLVAAALPPTQRTLSDAELATLSSVTLKHSRHAFNYAAQFLFHSID